MTGIPVFVQRDWHNDANCLGADPDIFFPERGQSAQPAKEICRACDVQVECLTDALNRGETEGIWGGLSARERRKLRNGQVIRTAGRPSQPIKHGTPGGANAHRRRGEEPCDACREARNAYEYSRKYGEQAAS